MDSEKQKKLFQTFPLLYRDIAKPMTVTAACWGIETGSGWFDLIWDLSAKLEACIEKMREENPELDLERLPTMSQCKEKYGTLRFYLTSSTEEMEKYVDDAEEKSGQTCEICGKPGQINLGNWLVVRCREHWPANEKDYDKTAKEHEDWLKDFQNQGGCV